MADSIYLIHGDRDLVEMVNQPYDAEERLQELLARYPSLLAGEQVEPRAPRRWLLVSREQPIPGEEGGGGRWALDHLFLDQDGIPTLVEVKRSTDTRIRREVVGQMLDYAANAVVFWPVETIRAKFEARCAAEGRKAEDVLLETLGVESEADAYWDRVKTNLQAGRVRLVFVADEIPPELRRIVEFLNAQMDPAQVLAVEIRQYVGGALRTLVPRVIGQTAEAELRKSQAGDGGRSWDRESFLQAVREGLPADQAAAVARVFEAAERVASDMGYGRGRTGSISPKFEHASTKSFFTLRATGALQINRQWHDKPDAGERAASYRDEFVRRLEQGGLRIPEGHYPTLSAEQWSAQADMLARVIGEVFGPGDPIP